MPIANWKTSRFISMIWRTRKFEESTSLCSPPVRRSLQVISANFELSIMLTEFFLLTILLFSIFNCFWWLKLFMLPLNDSLVTNKISYLTRLNQSFKNTQLKGKNSGIYDLEFAIMLEGTEREGFRLRSLFRFWFRCLRLSLFRLLRVICKKEVTWATLWLVSSVWWWRLIWAFRLYKSSSLFGYWNTVYKSSSLFSMQVY